MEESKIKQIFNQIDYKTYKNIERATTGIATILPITAIITNSALITIPIATPFLAYQLLTQTNKYQNHTKEATETKKLYDELIELYKKLLIELELEHPTEVYALYKYMYRKGYLSNGNNFIFGTSEAPEISDRIGINVITGKAVCRNISGMLGDIYKSMGINTEQLALYVGDGEFSENKLRSSIRFYEKKLANAKEEEKIKEIEKKLKTCKEILDKKLILESIIKKPGNHIITISEYDGKCYLYDPTNLILYKKDESFNYNNIFNSKIITYDNCQIASVKNSALNTKQIKNNTKNIISLEDSDKKENMRIILQTDILVKNNLDMLERFREENKELYGDIDNSLRKIRKKNGMI